MNAVSPAKNLEVLSEVTVQQLGKMEDEGTALLQSHNSEADHQKIVRVSRGGAPY